MRVHQINNSLPEFFTELLVNGFVAYDSELMRARRDKNEHGVAIARFLHAEPLKFLLRNNQRVAIQLSTLNVNADLARGL